MSQKVKVSVLELKSQLKVLQKPTSGNKDVLIERLGWANLPQSFDMFNDSSSSQLDGSNDQETTMKNNINTYQDVYDPRTSLTRSL